MSRDHRLDCNGIYVLFDPVVRSLGDSVLRKPLRVFKQRLASPCVELDDLDIGGLGELLDRADRPAADDERGIDRVVADLVGRRSEVGVVLGEVLAGFESNSFENLEGVYLCATPQIAGVYGAAFEIL